MFDILILVDNTLTFISFSDGINSQIFYITVPNITYVTLSNKFL